VRLFKFAGKDIAKPPPGDRIIELLQSRVVSLDMTLTPCGKRYVPVQNVVSEIMFMLFVGMIQIADARFVRNIVRNRKRNISFFMVFHS